MQDKSKQKNETKTNEHPAVVSFEVIRQSVEGSLPGNDPLAQFEHLRITEKTDIPKPETIVSVNGEIIAEAGDITTISGGSKAGKSGFTCYIIADTISANINDPISGINAKFNSEGKAIVHIDTEQSRYGHQRNYKSKILKRAGLDISPTFLLSYNIRKLSLDEYQPITSGICAAAKEKFTGIHMIVIDGVADYIKDSNNEAESSNIVKYFLHLAEKYQCAVILIIHVNPAPAGRTEDQIKERGHLGSELQRKSQSLLSVISSKEGVSTIHAKLFRNAGRADFAPISLKYDKQKGYHVNYEYAEANRAKLVELAAKIFGGGNAYEYGEALIEIEKTESIKERAAKDRFKEMKIQGLIMENSDKKWQKNPVAYY